MNQSLSHLTFAERHLLVRILRIQGFLYRRTAGRIGHRMPGMPPSLLLHTIGAKTGASHAVVLTYARDRQDFLVVASMGGAPVAPDWYHNLKRRPTAQVNIGTERILVVANPISPGEPDYARLWRIVNDVNANHYEGYQRRTTRPIPIVRLTPA